MYRARLCSREACERKEELSRRYLHQVQHDSYWYLYCSEYSELIADRAQSYSTGSSRVLHKSIFFFAEESHYSHVHPLYIFAEVIMCVPYFHQSWRIEKPKILMHA